MNRTPHHYKPVGRVVLRRIGQDQLLVPVSGVAAHRNAVFPVNETAVFLWERLAEGARVADIAAALAEQFEVEPGEALDDCVRYAEDLVSQGLLERGGL